MKDNGFLMRVNIILEVYGSQNDINDNEKDELFQYLRRAGARI